MTTIITGANHGLGYGTALVLAKRGEDPIVLAGRDLPDLTAAAERIRTETGHPSLLPLHLDLASLASVRSFVADVARHALPPLHLLICNAGVSKSTTRERSVDGYEVTFAVNHLGHFLLTNLLLSAFRPPARILFVSSGVHDPANVGGPIRPPHYVKAEWLAYPERDPDQSTKESDAGSRAYANSKLCNILCTYELTRQLSDHGLSRPERPLTVNAFDPGLMAGTGLARDAAYLTRFLWHAVLPLASRFMAAGRTVARSSSDLAYLATTPELAHVTGKYFSGRAMIDSSTDSYDREKAADLWRASIDLCGLQPDESPLTGNAASGAHR